MHTFLTFIKEFKIPRNKELRDAKASFSLRQKTLFTGAIMVACIAMIVLVARVNSHFMVAVPADGGTIKEGIIGVPTLINPVLAVSDADKDLTMLVYSGLMRKTPDGSIVPDLAQSYTISADGMTYTFIIKDTATFQDGSQVTAEDVIFTIEKIKDPLVKSPRKLGWDGITVSKSDNKTVIFTLNQPYISFLDNTTIGILPSHLWKNISVAEFGLSALNNIKSIGSGPYRISKVTKDSEDVPQSYILERFKGFALGTPHIDTIKMVSFANEKDLINALISHDIDQASGISPENANEIIKEGYTIHAATLPRIFGIFYNSENNKIFADKAVVSAFDKALDRKAIVDKVLNGYATTTSSPIPETIVKSADQDQIENIDSASLDEAKAILDRAGWVVGDDGLRSKGGTTRSVTTTKKVGKKTVKETTQVSTGPLIKLSFSLTTGDTPELQDAASVIIEQLEKLGVSVEIKVYEPGPLNQLVRSRSYEGLFFGQIVNHESNLFSFWHSSQKTDPGLNIALYGNKNADTTLESAQKTQNRDDRLNLYQEFVEQFNKDIPALLVYSPKYLYATKSTLHNLKLDTLTIPSDRLLSIYNWHTTTDHVWKIFVD